MDELSKLQYWVIDAPNLWKAFTKPRYWTLIEWNSFIEFHFVVLCWHVIG